MKALANNHLLELLPDGRWKIKFDHHMISDFALCESLFSLKHVPNQDGLIMRGRGGFSWYAAFGIWWAKVLEDWYLLMEQHQKGEQPEDGPPLAKETLLALAVRHWKAEDMDRFALLAPKQYEKFAQGYFGLDFDGRMIKFPVGASKLAMQYFDYQEAMRDKTNWKVIAVETTFGTAGDVIIAQDDEIVVAYQGRPDIVVYDNSVERIEPVDTKTTSNIDNDWRGAWKPHAQMCGYIVATQELCNQLGIKAEIGSVIINGCARDEPSKNPRDGVHKPRLERLRVTFTPEELQEWRRDMHNKAKRMMHCLKTGEWTWNQGACNYQFGSGCEYREYHRQSPEQRQLAVQSHYQFVKPWTPNRPD